MPVIWYESLGYKDNPFSLKPAVYGNMLFGYDPIIDELLYRADSGSMVFLEGQVGSGKTSLLKLVEERYRSYRRVWYFSSHDIHDKDIRRLLLERQGIWQRVFGIRPRHMIVLFDEVEALPANTVEQAKYFFDENVVKSIVFAGTDYGAAPFSESVKERINRAVIRIEPLTPQDAVLLVQHRTKNSALLQEDVIRELHRLAKGNPRRLLAGCEHLCRFAVAGGESTVTKEHLDALLKGKPMPKRADPAEIERKIAEQAEQLKQLQHQLASMRGRRKGIATKVVDFFDE